MSNQDLEQRVQALEKLVEKHSKDAEKQKIIQECTKILVMYESVHTPDLMHRTAEEVFALWCDDVSMEVSDWGVFTGPKSVKYLFEVIMFEDQIGTIMEHHLDTPYIEVAGDLQSAKATWWSSGMESVFDPSRTDLTDKQAKCVWSWGKYAIDFARNPDTGEWRIWHLKWFRTFRVNYYKSWIDDWKQMNISEGFPKGNVAEKMASAGVTKSPTTFHRPYRVDTMRHPFPWPPKPYETYDGSFSWWWGEEDFKQRYNADIAILPMPQD